MQNEETKILVVDDSETHRQFLTYVLSSADYKVTEAKDGIEALKKADEENPDLIISDILMPGMDGYEVIEHLKQNPKLSKIKIILYTAQYQRDEAIKLAKLFGISHYLDKPAEKNQLLAMVEEALGEQEPVNNNINSLPNTEEIAKQHLNLINNSLFKQVNDLEKLKSGLEERIAERTKELENLNKKLHDDSIHDPLTGLFNRRYLNDFMLSEIARSKRSGKSFVVVMLDIDHFKLFNDSYGHAAGDLVLTKVAGYIQNNMRSEDIICRFGGEEFVLILVDYLEREILERLENLRKGLANLEVEIEGKLRSVTVSMGYSIFPKQAQEAKELIELADQALYEAKKIGRNCIVPYETIQKNGSIK